MVDEITDEVITIKENFSGEGLNSCMLLIFVAPEVKASIYHQVNVASTTSLSLRSVHLFVDNRAKVDVYETIDLDDNSFVTSYKSEIKGDAFVDYKGVSRKGKLFYSENIASVLAPNAGCKLQGFWNVSSAEQTHHLARCNHVAPHTTSYQQYQGCVDGKAIASFEGQIYVDQKAQQTDSYQLSKHMLLSEKAKGFSKPNLEVFADDVKASHGATVSAINEEELFYLASRGIAKDCAKTLLKRGFLSFFLDEIEEDGIRNSFRRFIDHEKG